MSETHDQATAEQQTEIQHKLAALTHCPWASEQQHASKGRKKCQSNCCLNWTKHAAANGKIARWYGGQEAAGSGVPQPVKACTFKGVWST